jgi:hypothetical protein
MKKERKWTELSSATFVFIFFAEMKMDTNTPKISTKQILTETDTDRIWHGRERKADDYWNQGII